MNRRTVSSTHLPTLRPLAASLLLALTTLPMWAAFARDLDDERAQVNPGDAPEAWRLINDSHLGVVGGKTLEIVASGTSRISLERGAEVTRGGTAQDAIRLSGDARVEADSSRILGGISLLGHNAEAYLRDSEVIVTTAGQHPDERKAVGVDLVVGAAGAGVRNPYAWISGTTIRVEDAPNVRRQYNSGLGVRLQMGQMDILDGSHIIAANIGALLFAETNPAGRVRLSIDNSTLESARGAAIQVIPLQENRYDISVANGAQLRGGDGNLLLVRDDAFVTGAQTDVTFTVDDSRLAGNITFDPGTVNGTLDVALRNKAQIDGRFFNVTSASIDDNSTWLLTGDSSVGRLALGSTGTIGLGDGTTFNTLTVDSFTGDGGTLAFNTQLGDDTSASDKLVITGDANGQANVRVTNAGGSGAKTDRGIELIDIGGASNAQFDLVGRAVGGQYEYFLVKDANGNWYLRSDLAAGPDPCLVDPSLPECKPVDPIDPVDPPSPVLRPEAGAYLANQFAMDQLLRHQWRDRQGGSTAIDGVRGWARVDGTQSKLSAVEDQLDLRVDRSRLQLGADVGVFDNGRGRVGVMGTLAQSSATSRSQLTGYSARGKVEGGALGVYGNWNTDALYVDASVQRGQFRNRVQGEGLAEERYDSDIWQSSLEAGYRFDIGQIGNTALRLQPELQLVYTDATTDRHTEGNGTIVRGVGDDGLSGRLGLRLQGESRATVGAAVSPYLAVNWYRDGSSNGMAFDEDVLQASLPRNRYEVSAGGRVDFRSGLSGWGGLGVMRGDHGYREATANLG
ncbi:autotransporter outer membrane beta-barrel domain-containing protein, partial [Stenotrophomonas sp. HMWF003]|uniref:autotransporter family protein n=1 Tax=Stenotrophomonas sp. HMWF003 TaxID=2056840 RepID=UPI000D4CCB55